MIHANTHLPSSRFHEERAHLCGVPAGGTHACGLVARVVEEGGGGGGGACAPPAPLELHRRNFSHGLDGGCWVGADDMGTGARDGGDGGFIELASAFTKNDLVDVGDAALEPMHAIEADVGLVVRIATLSLQAERAWTTLLVVKYTYRYINHSPVRFHGCAAPTAVQSGGRGRDTHRLCNVCGTPTQNPKIA